MKLSLKAFALALVVMGVFCVNATRAQNREKFVISAKAGGVNSVLGRVTFQKKGQPQAELLSAQSNLDAGDLVDTGRTGRVEVLLNPGSYLRAGEASRFELTDNSVENLTVKLLQGVAIVEATGANDVNTEIALVTPNGSVELVKRGIYRINVTSGQTEVMVLKGKAIVNGSALNPIRGGQKAVIGSGPMLTAKLDKSAQDDFDSWSRNRAELLAKANSRVSARALNSYLSSLDTVWPVWGYSGRNGLWLFNSRSMCFTFLPFYYGWSSPYGMGYPSQFYYGGWNGYSYGRYPIVVNNPTSGGGGPVGPNPSGSGGGTGSGGGSAGSFPGRAPISIDVDRSGPRGKNIESSDPHRP